MIGRVAHESPGTGAATLGEREAAGALSLRSLSVSLAEVQRISNCEKKTGGQDGSFEEDLLA